jgi:hypothetical protein
MIGLAQQAHYRHCRMLAQRFDKFSVSGLRFVLISIAVRDRRHAGCKAKHIRVAILRPVTSKTGVIGIGLPLKSLRRKPQLPRRDCGFLIRATFFRRLDGRAQARPVSRKWFPGRPTRRAAASDWPRVRWFQ